MNPDLTPQAPQPRLKIMVADDDDAIHLCMQEIAEQQKWDLALAKDGRECLEKLTSQDPDVLVLDLRMPHFSGIEIISELRAQDRKIPVILISADANICVHSTLPGVVAVLSKPFDLCHFLDAVEAALPSSEAFCT